jgi:hypothetical protein
MACTGPADYRQYEKLVKKELATNQRYDSLFLGIYLGMPSKDFYTHCWDLNRKGLITNGSISASVLWKLKTEFTHPVELNFYPEFYDGKIFKMWATFNYEAWAPWNKHLFADSLKSGVVDLMKKWYGNNNFVELSDSLRGNIFVKVDGNRRIIIGRQDDTKIKVDFTDLLIEQKLKKK